MKIFDTDIQNESELGKIKNIAYKNFNNNCLNQKIDGKEIFFAKSELSTFNIDFLHMISLENKDCKGAHYYNIKPCVNTELVNICKNCSTHTYNTTVRNKNRDFCFYRMMFLDLFNETIRLANERSELVKMWKVDSYLNRRQKETHLKIWYKMVDKDYLVILKEGNNMYQFITAYPVFEQSEKELLKKEYCNKNSIKIQ